MSRKVSKPKAVLIDIEGTTSDRQYIKQTLFPFIRNNLSKFLTETYDSKETKEAIKRLRDAQQSGEYPGMPTIVIGNKGQVISSVNENIMWQMRKHVVAMELKQIELLCWVWAYETRQLKGHVYDDVSIALHEWKVNQGIKLYTYSTGIVWAQKLLLVNTNHGNLCPLIDQYFDACTAGEKTESKSYKTISNKIGVNVRDILFITDDSNEGKTASSAGLRVLMIKRPGNKPIEGTGLQIITSFADIKW